MKYYVSFILLLIAISHSTCNAEDDADCYDSQFGRYGGTFKVGEVRQAPGECGKVECKSDGSLSFLSCAVAALQPGCKIIPYDFSKPYPDCCEKYDCPNHHN